MINNKFVAMVDQIPVDQKAKATTEIKRFLLRKAKAIRERRDTIDEAARKQRREQILAGYRKAIGYEKMKKQVDDLDRKITQLKAKILQAGLYVNGNLIDTGQKEIDPDGNVQMWYEGAYVVIPKETLKSIVEVQKLIAAVEGEMDTFGLFDQLETRMMMASSVGEAMAIVNALAGDEIFRINYDKLGISPSGQKQLKDKETK